MAPTICLPELSMQGNTSVSCSSCRSSNYVRRTGQRVNQNNINNRKEQQRLEFKRIFNRTRNDYYRGDVADYLSPPASPVWEPAPTLNHNATSPSDTGDLAVSNIRTSQHWRSVYSRREGLLEIVARTMTLVRRSHALQKRVNALGYETREFIRSVLNNPENNATNCCEDFAQSETESVCSSTSGRSLENSDPHSYREVEVHLLSRPTPPATPDSSTGSDQVFVDTDKERYSYENEENEDQDDTRDRVTQDPMVSSS